MGTWQRHFFCFIGSTKLLRPNNMSWWLNNDINVEKKTMQIDKYHTRYRVESIIGQTEDYTQGPHQYYTGHALFPGCWTNILLMSLGMMHTLKLLDGLWKDTNIYPRNPEMDRFVGQYRSTQEPSMGLQQSHSNELWNLNLPGNAYHW